MLLTHRVGIELNRKIYVHCAAGKRAAAAAGLLLGMRYTNVIPLAEGFTELAAHEILQVATGKAEDLFDAVG